MKENIGEEIKRNPFIEILDKRTFHAYRFTGTDENISIVQLFTQQTFKNFRIFRVDKDDSFCLNFEDICGLMSYIDINIGDWIILKGEEDKTVVRVVSDKLFSNYYETADTKMFKNIKEKV